LIKSWTHEKSHLDTNWVLPRSRYLCHTTGVAYHRHGDSTTHHWPWQAKTTFKNSAIFVSFSLLLITSKCTELKFFKLYFGGIHLHVLIVLFILELRKVIQEKTFCISFIFFIFKISKHLSYSKLRRMSWTSSTQAQAQAPQDKLYVMNLRCLCN
jgi:hypothetical protein